MDTTPEVFASKHRAVVITPAGCGKTELIARAVACQGEGRQLILTHTHAGVKSLRDRLRKLGVSSRSYRVETIAGFALKYALSFPRLSGLAEFVPCQTDWNQVYVAGTRVLSDRVGRKVLSATYRGLYVDEYQDCSRTQHALIMALADVLPCRIVGDPLQGIFDFGGNELVDWVKDVLPQFERLSGMTAPWRWVHRNKALGRWLLVVRDCLCRGSPIDLERAPAGVCWMPLSPRNQVRACYRSIQNNTDSVVAIQRLAHEAHSVAMRLRGTFTSMEEVESRDLLDWATRLEQSAGPGRAVATLEFASKCMTGISSQLGTLRRRLEAGHQCYSSRIKHPEIALALDALVSSSDVTSALHVFSLIEALKGCVVYRRELWQAMKRAIRDYDASVVEATSLRDAAWKVRDRGRLWGRRVDCRTVSRALLIKGLEFDRSVVLNADELTTKELYVAMTRGSKYLTVLSSDPLIKRPPPFDFRPSGST